MPAQPKDPNPRLRLVVDRPRQEFSEELTGGALSESTPSPALSLGSPALPSGENEGASGLALDSGAFRRDLKRPTTFSRRAGLEGVPSGETGSGGPSSRRLGEDQARPGRGELGPEERQDEELVALACSGQSSAFEALYRRHSAYAMALGVRVQGNPTDIEDIVHDAFLRAHDRLDTLRAGASFRPWLSSVVVSLVRSRLRRRRMLTVLGLSTAEPIDLDSLVAPEAGPEVRAQIAQVYQVLERVPVDHRICWTLRYVEGRKLEDVAEIAKCSLATAKRRIAAVQQEILLLEATQTEDAPRSSRRLEPLEVSEEHVSERLVEAAAPEEKSSVKGSPQRGQDLFSKNGGDRHD